MLPPPIDQFSSYDELLAHVRAFVLTQGYAVTIKRTQTDVNGKVKNVKLVSGNGALATEAFRAVRQWRYTPYLLKGEPIEVETRIVMDFNAR